MRKKVLDADGVPIHYEVHGEGKPIVLVHGFASSLQGNWVNTGWVETLSPIRQVVALDCRGHGKSGKPHEPEAYSGTAMQDDVIRVMDHLGIQQADLFGYSMGGGISLRLLLGHPERFTSVVLGGIGNVLARSTAGRPGVAQAMQAKDPSTVTDPVAKGFRTFAEAGGNDLRALSAYQRSRRERTDAKKLGQVAVPVLLVIGEKDALVGSPEELRKAIPGARLLTITDRDHLTVVPDRRFKDAVVEFLTETAAE